MLDTINWYLVELKMRLTPHFEAQRVYSILSEAESHLKESAAKIEAELNLPPERAAQVAVEAYGDPEEVALGYLREAPSKILGVRAVYWVLVGAFLCLLCSNLNWMWLWGFFDNSGDTWQNYFAGIIGACGLVALLAGLLRGKRSYRLQILAVGAGFSVLLVLWLSFVMIGSDGHNHGISRFHFARDVADLQQTIPKLDRIQVYLRRARLVFANAKSPADLAPEFRNVQVATSELGFSMNNILPVEGQPSRVQIDDSFPVPREAGVFSEINGAIVALDSDSSFAEAKRDWAENGESAFKQTRDQELGMEGLLQSANEAQYGRVFFFNPDVYGDPMAWTILLTGGFLIADAVVFAVVRRKRPWRRRILA